MSDAAPRAVLVVDDSPLVVDALSAVLEIGGYAVVSAGSVHDAVTALDDRQFDAMLLDLTLPDGDGLEVLSRAAAVPPTVALTGHDDPETEARCRAAGCRNVLVKPVNARRLLQELGALAHPG